MVWLQRSDKLNWRSKVGSMRIKRDIFDVTHFFVLPWPRRWSNSELNIHDLDSWVFFLKHRLGDPRVELFFIVLDRHSLTESSKLMPATVVVKNVFIIPKPAGEAWETYLAKILAVQRLMRVRLNIPDNFHLVRNIWYSLFLFLWNFAPFSLSYLTVFLLFFYFIADFGSWVN